MEYEQILKLNSETGYKEHDMTQESLRERFVNALTAMIELFDSIDSENKKRITTLEDTVKRLQGEIHAMQYEVKQLKRSKSEPAQEGA